jgi:hypothetical protein
MGQGHQFRMDLHPKVYDWAAAPPVLPNTTLSSCNTGQEICLVFHAKGDQPRSPSVHWLEKSFPRGISPFSHNLELSPINIEEYGHHISQSHWRNGPMPGLDIVDNFLARERHELMLAPNFLS